MKGLMVVAISVYSGIFFSCKQTLPTSSYERKSSTLLKPLWVDSPPVSDDYYIGVARVSKIGSNYQQQALTKALESIATSISVVIKTNSLLSTFESRNSFREKYESTIETKTQQDLEGYEVVDAWSNAQEYWIYCRLSKAKFAAIQEKKKSEVVHVVLNYFDQAKVFQHHQDFLSALRFYGLTLSALKNYLGESILVSNGEESFDLAVKSYSSIQQILNQIVFKKNVSPLVLDQRISQRNAIVTTLHFTQGNTLIPLSGMPVLVQYDSTSQVIHTDDSGNASFFFPGFFKTGKTFRMTWKLHAASVFGDSVSSAFHSILSEMFSYPFTEIIVKGAPLTAFITSKEYNLQKPLERKMMQPFLSAFLNDYGIGLTTSKAQADLLIDLNVETEKGGETGGLFITYLDLRFQISDKHLSKVIYAGQLQRVKGVKLSFEQAGLEAYRNAQEQMKTELHDQVLNIIFK